MQISDILAQMGGMQSMAKSLGVSEQDAMQGAAALLPAILGGMKKQAQNAGGADLGGLLGQLGGGLFGQLTGAQANDSKAGNDILGQIFGSKDVSRAVAQDAASQSGLDAGVLKQMLPMLATLVTGYLGKQGAAGLASSGGLGNLVGSLLGGGKSQQSGLSGLLSMLDANGDGNVLDDILRAAGKLGR